MVGQENQLLYGPAQISMDKSNKWGLTALGVLDASGLAYGTSSWSYGYLVNAIEGLANEGLSGWMFTVNDKVPGSGADKCNIKVNDRIIFYYSSSMDQQPPKWGELGKKPASGGGGSPSAGPSASVKDSDLNAAIKNAGAAGLVALAADDKSVTLTLSREQIAKIHDAGFPLAVTIQGAKFILSPDGLKVKELSTDKAAHMKFSASKLGSDDVRKLTESLAAGLRLAGEIYELNIQVLNKDGTSRDIANLPHCLVLLPLPEGLEEDAAGWLKAYRYNEASRQWEDAGGTYDPDQKAVGFQVEHFSKYALLEAVPPTPEKVVFSDIIGHWARPEIQYMAAAGYVNGVGENQFSPETKITRAEFTAILVRLAGLETAAGAAECFADVPADAWYRGLAGAAARAGLILGVSENSFAPDELVTREQMAAILVRFMSKKGAAAPAGEAGEAGDAGEAGEAWETGLLSGFGDSGAISSWARTFVAQAVKDGLMAGRDAGRFLPQDGATRAEATVVLYRAMQKLPPVNPETDGR
ncbi:MAG: Endo-1,4-beta-xylanase A precursor [Firmicutes bacterium ADurb.Bin456]|nr:MAG: Endo-1,4-beta-xylanase A precursor [Firmicutes bacterium ADurb.Bin456]